MKLSRLELLEVRTEDGQRLGHVFDLRLRMQASRPWPDEVEGVVFGTVGLLERLGLRSARTHVLPWRDVVGVRNGTLVVKRAPGSGERR